MAIRITRRKALQAVGGSCLAGSSRAGSMPLLSFWVFGLLRPSQLVIRGVAQTRLHCSSSARDWVLEPGDALLVDEASAPLRISGPEGEMTKFVLDAPGRLQRQYYGTLQVCAEDRQLVPVVSMNIETAVNSIVGAELPLTRTQRAALAAQAVVARSFLAGTRAPRHHQASFCDTTHCQFLRSPGGRDSSVSRAVNETSGLVLTSTSGVFPASYSAACGGATRAGERDGYIYRSIKCEICRRSHTAQNGHGWGLCQLGAMGLAEQGRSWRNILAEYFPDVSCTRLAG